ncbi:hypothetical protein [Archangium lansingense]|uniref:Uncharacterized protein n=1 Tax=Archangium lansingense TaxID=2995310 RepID=A0ABT4ACF1_9BACT|nr:hypothetical protein [Archangium lansinium]MCY1079349.1 hypothetical protein [Archangium lansinium]
MGALLFGSAVMAEPVEPARPISQAVSVGYTNLRTLSWYIPSWPTNALDATYLRAAGTEGFRSNLYYGGGLRVAVPFPPEPVGAAFPLEIFARAELRTRLGIWEPAGGLELGTTLIPPLWPYRRLPTAHEQNQKDAELHGPAYFAIHAAPLRFHVGRFVLGGPELQFGPVGPPLGTVVRLQVGLARLEMKL